MGAIEDAKTYGLTIRESATDGSDFTNPDADYRRMFLGEDGQLHVKDSAGTVTDIGTGGGGGGGSVSSVDQDISADFTSASDSAWHDITGLTGIVLAAGTWIGMVDLEIDAGVAFGPVFRIYDGTDTYAQMGWIASTPPADISGHHVFTMKPTVLGSSTTMVIQVYTDTALTVRKYPTRGGISTAVASHVTFLKIA